VSNPTKKPSVAHHAARYLLGGAGITVLAVLILGTFALSFTLAGPALNSPQMAAVVSARLVDLTNTDRASSQLGTLALSPVLTQAAQAKADDMAKHSYFAHTSPSGLTSWYWFQQAGYSFSYAGENLAVDFTDSDEVNQAWLNSPGHRANILDGHYTQIGIATAQGTYEGHPTTFVVQMFGAPAKPAPITVQNVPTDPTQVATARTIPPNTQVLGASTQPAPKPTVTTPKKTVVAVADKQPVNPLVVTDTSPAPAYSPLQVFAPLAGSPRALLRDVYLFFGLILAIALAFRTGFELKRHHMKHVFAVLLLFVLMGSLFYVADRFVFVTPILGSAQSV
jgi:uncharacterized protein YkwD